MKQGQKVLWTDPVSERTRFGVLVERNQVVAKAETDNNLFPKQFKDVDYYTWDVKEDVSGKRFCINEEEIKIVLPN